jgi:DNA-binding transcriptional MerR regulator/ubiquinone/menaquinone biosynthesis C-methylase UbiE
MKISSFADKYNISTDTVRYYMDLNLIIPEKIGGHYQFDQKCEEQITKILNLKEMKFTLQEIKNIFNYHRMGKLTNYQQNNYYQDIYRKKIEEIETEIGELENALDKLKDKVEELSHQSSESRVELGLPISFLNNLCCPVCSSNLTLYADRVSNNEIFEGSLECRCGESIIISDGILNLNSLEREAEIEEEIVTEIDHINSYIQATAADFIDKSYQSLEWMEKHFIKLNKNKKIILELGSGYGYFLRQIYLELPDNCYYICADRNLELNKFLKKTLEMTGVKKNIIFINTDLPELPLTDNSVDILIDFTGTSSYSFENKGFLLQNLERFYKEDMLILATFIIYKTFGTKNIVQAEYRSNFKEEVITEKLSDLNFSIKNEFRSDIEKIKESPGEYESFAQKGDKIYSYQLSAERWS